MYWRYLADDDGHSTPSSSAAKEFSSTAESTILSACQSPAFGSMSSRRSKPSDTTASRHTSTGLWSKASQAISVPKASSLLSPSSKQLRRQESTSSPVQAPTSTPKSRAVASPAGSNATQRSTARESLSISKRRRTT